MKNLFNSLLILTAMSITIACTNSNTASDDQDSTGIMDHSMTADSMGTSSDRASATISSVKADTSGSGKVEFVKKNDNMVEMSLTVNFPKMANKSVAVHFHEHGDCSDEGKGAHGHWNPTNEPHGKWGSSTHHSGDIGNIELDAQGNGSITVSSDRWTIGGDDKTNVVNRAVIVHSGVDDYKTQPTGNAGSRIGCGVITAL